MTTKPRIYTSNGGPPKALSERRLTPEELEIAAAKVAQDRDRLKADGEMIFNRRHRQNGIAFAEWLKNPTELLAKEPIGLVAIDAVLQEQFEISSSAQWRTGMKGCVATLRSRGWRPMLFDKENQRWTWTDRFNGWEGNDDSPEGIAEAAVDSWAAFGDSGGAEGLRFATALPSSET